MISFFTLEISFGSLLKPKNRNLKKIADLKVYCNLKTYSRFRQNRKHVLTSETTQLQRETSRDGYIAKKLNPKQNI